MNCYYCDKIKSVVPSYASSPASRDLGSAAPRCDRHWRYLCGACGEKVHFMSTAFCAEAEKFFCSACATATERVAGEFWAWSYHFSYRSPWSGREAPSLDRMEFEGNHPLQDVGRAVQAQATVSEEACLVRYPESRRLWRSDEDYTDADVQANWDANAERWDAMYDDDGDRNRRYQSDEPMLRLLGDVHSREILDVGSGNGYLCRKLPRREPS